MLTRANKSEYNLVLKILDQSAYWLKMKSIDQWPYPTPHWERELIKSAIEGNAVYLYHDDEGINVIGVARLELAEEHLWTDGSPFAVYLHNFVLAEGFHGKGYGKRFLSEIEEWVINIGRNMLRLDCHYQNRQLQDWYLSRGFKYVKDYTYKDWTTSLFEKTLSNESSEAEVCGCASS